MALAAARDARVPISSALGHNKDRDLTVAFPEANCWVVRDIGHLDLLDDADVFAQLRWIMAAPAPG